MSTIPFGTVRFVPRSGYSSTAPLVGHMVLPDSKEFEGVEPGDCVEVILQPGGVAEWRVVKKGVLKSGHENQVHNPSGGTDPTGKDFNSMYREGVVGAACWTDLTEDK